MGRKNKKTPGAADLVRQALEGLAGRTQAAAHRVVTDRHDPDAVHDFRVGLRRLRTVLRASRQLYGKKRMGSFIRSVKALGDATSALRDAEVLAETIEATHLGADARAGVRDWLVLRADRQALLRAEAIELVARSELGRTFEDLLTEVRRPPKSEPSVRAFARKQLRSARRGVVEALPVDRADAAGLHRLRIRFKRLRYTAEMLGQFMTNSDAAASLRVAAPPAGDVNYGAVAALASRMQKTLGLLHDADVVLDAVADTDELSDDLREEVTAALLRMRVRLVDHSIERLTALPDELLGRDVLRVTADRSR